MDNLTSKQLAEAISNFVNCNGRDAMDEVVVHMHNEHRTLQQSFTKLCLKWVENMASTPERRTDARNSASREICKMLLEGQEIMDNYGDTPSNYLPCI